MGIIGFPCCGIVSATSSNGSNRGRARDIFTDFADVDQPSESRGGPNRLGLRIETPVDHDITAALTEASPQSDAGPVVIAVCTMSATSRGRSR